MVKVIVIDDGSRCVYQSEYFALKVDQRLGKTQALELTARHVTSLVEAPVDAKTVADFNDALRREYVRGYDNGFRAGRP